MSESKTASNKSTPLIALSILIMLSGIVLFYYFSEVRLFYRVLGILTVLIISSAIIYQTDFGKTVHSYISDSKQELKKVVWPTKQETTQTALGVIAIVVIIGLVLWLIDMFFGWSIGTLYGVN
tara:strand:+ start:68 stop:436 length:369 start_codon:yes stop_codon:yes gene_type:complete